MDLITIDMETYYDSQYSLSKISTEEYVRDPDFEVIGFAYKVNDGPTEWVTGPESHIHYVLKDLPWKTSLVLAHNTLFDGAILSWHYDVKPKGWLDTLSMGRALHGVDAGGSLKAMAERYGVGEKGVEVQRFIGYRRVGFSQPQLESYGKYCVNDVELTYLIFNKMMQQGFPMSELKLIDLTLRMFIHPVLELDARQLELHLEQVAAGKQAHLVKALQAIGRSDLAVKQIVGDEEMKDEVRSVLMSNPKFAEMLQSLGVEPPRKISMTTGKETLAFAKSDDGFKALLEHSDERIQALAAARIGTKSTLEETRTQRFIDVAKRGKFPVPLKYYAAHTGRWGGTDSINLQNLPSRGDNAGKLKKAILAPEGYVFIDADSSQIEARTLAWEAGQDDLVSVFEKNNAEILAGVPKNEFKYDPYKLMASQIYSKPTTEITDPERFVGKTTILGAGYGMGGPKFKAQLAVFGTKVEEAEAKRIIDTYRATYPKIPELWRVSHDALRCMVRGQTMTLANGLLTVDADGILLPNGLHIHYKGLREVADDQGKRQFVYDTRNGQTKIYGGKCLAADTEVLTSRGWVKICQVTPDDKLWDGVEWVNHMGLTYQGYKPTIILDGVRMTTDHLVLTTDGWVNASSCEGLFRADFRMPDSNQVHGGRTPLRLGVQVRLRGSGSPGSNKRSEVRQERRQPLMRMCRRTEEQNTRALGPSGVLGVEVYAGQMPRTLASIVEKLRGAWDKSMSSMGAIVQGILGRHGFDVSAGAYAGPQRQLGGLHTGELPMGVVQSSSGQSAGESSGGYGTSSAPNGGSAVNPAVPMAPEPVYDVINAGPRTRFVVRGATGPLIVHNCVENYTQAVARCIIGEQMLRIAKRYRVVLTVHDAIGIIAREQEAEEARAYVESCMRWVPSWAEGLPVNCESGMGRSYGDC